jgi:CO/xanthine dehydrogenase Mo-binding subunit
VLCDARQVLTGSFMGYAMPRVDDFCTVVIEDNPVPTSTNPVGVKGAGEIGTVGSPSAGANALVDALSVLGIRHVDMPSTPHRVLASHSGSALMGTLVPQFETQTKQYESLVASLHRRGLPNGAEA